MDNKKIVTHVTHLTKLIIMGLKLVNTNAHCARKKPTDNTCNSQIEVRIKRFEYSFNITYFFSIFDRFSKQ